MRLSRSAGLFLAALSLATLPGGGRVRPAVAADVCGAARRFLLREAPLLARDGETGPEAIVIGDGAVAIRSPGGDCPPTGIRWVRTKRTNVVRAIWRSCQGLPGRVRLRARVDASCEEMSGVLNARRAGVSKGFVARYSHCGDGVLDADGGEQCEQPGEGGCNAQCRYGPECEFWQASCGGQCVSLLWDVAHCGDCATQCAQAPHAQPRCVGGTCRATCEAGFADCDGDPANGCEADLSSDASHCGTCNRACREGTEACEAGRCTSNCPEAYGDCNQDPLDGCETELRADVSNCGRCTHQCPAGAMAVATCTEGLCTVSCPEGLFGCGRDCVDRQTDAHHCGGCFDRCPSGFGCRNGRCTCEGSRNECDGVCVDLENDPANCNQCGRSCAANEICAGGSCRCPGGECGNVCVNKDTDPRNCGSCGTRCLAGEQCVAGVCRCQAPRRSCGMECVDFESDPQHCGSCSRACAAGERCVSGGCRRE